MFEWKSWDIDALPNRLSNVNGLIRLISAKIEDVFWVSLEDVITEDYFRNQIETNKNDKELERILKLYNLYSILSKKIETLNTEIEILSDEIDNIMKDVYDEIWIILITIEWEDTKDNMNNENIFPSFFGKAATDSYYHFLENYNNTSNPEITYWSLYFKHRRLYRQNPKIFNDRDTNPAYKALNCLMFKCCEKIINPTVTDVFVEFLGQVKQYLEEITLNYFSNNKTLVTRLNKLKATHKKVWYPVRFWNLVVGPSWNPSISREFWKLEQKMSSINIEDENNEREFLDTITDCLSDLYYNCPYNSIDYLVQTIKNKSKVPISLHDEEDENKRWHIALSETVRQKQENECTSFKWDICTWMSESIKEKLLKRWIKCDLIRFKASSTVNDDCLWDWHVWVRIIYKIGEEEKMVRIDPWLAIPEPIIFLKVKNKDEDERKNSKYSRYPEYTYIGKNMRYCLFNTWGHNYTWLILWLKISNEYELKVDTNNVIIISKDGKELEYDDKGELKDDMGKIYKISYNMDVLNTDFPYKMYVKDGDIVEQVYYISREWFIVNCNKSTNLELDLNHSLTNSRYTIGKDYFRVLRNLRYVRYDKDWNKVASINYPIRWEKKEIMLKWWKTQSSFEIGEWWIKISEWLIIKKVDEIIEKLKQLKLMNPKKFKKLLKIFSWHETNLNYESPLSIPLARDDVEKEVEGCWNIYNLICSLLEIYKASDSYLNYCEECESNPKNFSIDFDNKENQIFEKRIFVNGRYNGCLDYITLESLRNKKKVVTLNLSYIERISKSEIELLLNLTIANLYLNWLAELSIDEAGALSKLSVIAIHLDWVKKLGEWVAKALWKLRIKTLSLNWLEEITREEIESLSSLDVLFINWVKKLWEWFFSSIKKSNISTLYLNGLVISPKSLQYK